MAVRVRVRLGWGGALMVGDSHWPGVTLRGATQEVPDTSSPEPRRLMVYMYPTLVTTECSPP